MLFFFLKCALCEIDTKVAFLIQLGLHFLTLNPDNGIREGGFHIHLKYIYINTEFEFVYFCLNAKREELTPFIIGWTLGRRNPYKLARMTTPP